MGYRYPCEMMAASLALSSRHQINFEKGYGAMKRNFFCLFLLLGRLAISVRAHDLFLKFDAYFLRPNSQATVRLLNGHHPPLAPECDSTRRCARDVGDGRLAAAERDLTNGDLVYI